MMRNLVNNGIAPLMAYKYVQIPSGGFRLITYSKVVEVSMCVCVCVWGGGGGGGGYVIRTLSSFGARISRNL